MSSTSPPGGYMGQPSSPLIPEDPPKIGDFWLDSRLTATPSGIAYLGHGDGVNVLLILLSAGAAEDAAARDRLAGVVNELDIDTVVARGGHGQDEGRLGKKFRSEDDDPVEPDDQELAPWVALINDGSPAVLTEAQRILNEVDLSTLPHKGDPAGPDYRLHWVDDTRPGMARLWPLPWPGRHDRAGWVSILASWLLMLLIAALAVLIAILIFQSQSAGSPPPPLKTTSSQSGSPSGSPSQSGSPSGSPSQSGSPSGSPSQSGSESGSPTQSGTETSGTPTDSPGGVPSHTKTPTMISPTEGGTKSGGGSSETPNNRL